MGMQADSASRRVFGIMLKEVQALTRKPFSVPRASFILAAVLTLSMALTAIPRGLAQPLPGTFTSIDFPSASFTQAQGINPRGDIVGQYISACVGHGFLISRGSFTTIDFPGANSSFARGINPRGDIVGRYDSAGVTHGFLFSELPNRERATASEKKGENT